MLNFIYRKINNKKGFTLVELIVVMAILGILATIAVPKLSGYTSIAKTTADNATMKTIENAITASLANPNSPLSVTADTVLSWSNDTATWDAASWGEGDLGDTQVAELKKLLGDVPPDSQTDSNGFKVTIGADGSVTVASNK